MKPNSEGLNNASECERDIEPSDDDAGSMSLFAAARERSKSARAEDESKSTRGVIYMAVIHIKLLHVIVSNFS